MRLFCTNTGNMNISSTHESREKRLIILYLGLAAREDTTYTHTCRQKTRKCVLRQTCAVRRAFTYYVFVLCGCNGGGHKRHNHAAHQRRRRQRRLEGMSTSKQPRKQTSAHARGYLCASSLCMRTVQRHHHHLTAAAHRAHSHTQIE